MLIWLLHFVIFKDMQTAKNKKTILERVLLILGVSPTPKALFIARVVLIVVCVIGIFYTNNQSKSAERYGNHDEFLKEFPDSGL